MVTRHVEFYQNYYGIKSANEFNCFVYDKLLKVTSSTSRDQCKEGEILNFLQVDSQKIALTMSLYPILIVTPIQLGIYSYLIYDFIGIPYVSGIGSMLLFIGISLLVQIKYRQLMVTLGHMKDERLKVTTETFNNLKALKLYGWDSEFLRKIEQRRQEELSVMRSTYAWGNFNKILLWFAPLVVYVSTLFTYQLLNPVMDIANILTALRIFGSIFKPIRDLPRVISLLIETIVSLGRIEKFLNQDEVDESNVIKNDPDTMAEGIAIKVDNGNFSWGNEALKKNVINIPDGDKYTASINSQSPDIETENPIDSIAILKNINITINKGELVMIIGETGCGKSSLLNAILNNMLILNKHEAKIVTNGRVSYVSQTPWIQNDTVINNILFNHPYDEDKYNRIIEICELLPDFQILCGGDRTELGSRGANLSGGQRSRISVARALYGEGDIYILDDPFSSLDAQVSENIMKKAIVRHLSGKTRILVTHSYQHLHWADRIVLMKEGEINWQGTYKQFTEISISNDYVSIKGNSSSRRQSFNEDMSVIALNKAASQNFELKRTTKEEEQEEGSVKMSIYYTYIKQMGGICIFLIVIFCLIMWQTLRCGADYYYIWWTSNQDKCDPVICFWKYTLFATSTSIWVILRIIILTRGSLNCSKVLHSQIINNMIHAPINLFHDIVPKGQILNRLNKDMFNVDANIMYSYENVLVYFFGFLGAVALCSIIEIWSLVFMPFIVITGWLTARYYLRASRDLSRIDGIVRSSIVNLIGETIPGITTIRAAEYEGIYRKRFYERVDEYFNVRILFEGTSAWFGMHLDYIAVSMHVFLIVFTTYTDTRVFTDNEIALILSYSVSLQTVVFQLVTAMTTFENGMVSIERILQYTKVASEKPKHLPLDGEVPKWPTHGEIKFTNYSVRYRPDTNIVLRNINIHIRPQQKIGVVGRTGSGKSTLCLALFRILEPDTGTISIDGIDITTVGLDRLRQCLTIIPQDPHLMEGTLRYNIDPLGVYSNEEIKKVMFKFGLSYLADSDELGLSQYVSYYRSL
jgi:ATP-binding cassette subfamily C (CFTR/MRP) protein 2